MDINKPEPKWYTVEMLAGRFKTTVDDIWHLLETGQLKFAFREVNAISQDHAERIKCAKFDLDYQATRAIILGIGAQLSNSSLEQKLFFSEWVMGMASAKSISIFDILNKLGGSWQLVVLPEQLAEYIANTLPAKETPESLVRRLKEQNYVEAQIAFELHNKFPDVNGYGKMKALNPEYVKQWEQDNGDPNRAAGTPPRKKFDQLRAKWKKKTLS